jgi:hypothetical protein
MKKSLDAKPGLKKVGEQKVGQSNRRNEPTLSSPRASIVLCPQPGERIDCEHAGRIAFEPEAAIQEQWKHITV